MTRTIYLVISDIELVGEFDTLKEAKQRIKRMWTSPVIYKAERVELGNEDLKQFES